jgi:hypothetical protein
VGVFAVFIATMYSYGSDAACVGVDGIVGCMGVFLAYNKVLYAIHVPDAGHFQSGRTKFVAYLNQQANAFDGRNAHLYGVLNGTNRGGAYSELLEYAQDLSIKRITTVRLNEHLGKKGSMQDSAAVLCEFIPGSQECMLKYQKADEVKWTLGAGTPRAGYYHNSSFDKVLSTNAAVASGWNVVDTDNSTIVEKRGL